jgi:DNA-binding winged helix-turn-helix (wHTH) protein
MRIAGDELHTYFNTHPGVGYKVMERIALAALAKI